MKTLFSLIMLFMLVTGANAQDSVTEHMQFMGIPIDGTVKEFQKELSKKGFKRTNCSSKDQRKYLGTFSGEDAELFVSFENNTKQVYRVGVLIPCYTSAAMANSKYFNFKSRFESKYEAYTFTAYSSIYTDNRLLLEKSIKNGHISYLNSTMEWLSDEKKETCIFVSRPTLDRASKIDSLYFTSVYLNCLGNVGTITIKTFKINNTSFSYEGMKYENGIFIIYEDRKNASIIDEQNKADL